MNNKLDYIAIDFEIANQYRNSACSVGLVRFLDGKETDSCYSLIHPAKMYFIPEWTRDIHHIHITMSEINRIFRKSGILW